MHLKMGDVIMGMGKDFATEAMDISEKMSLNAGNVLFSIGECDSVWAKPGRWYIRPGIQAKSLAGRV
jgi:hypothetical protein